VVLPAQSWLPAMDSQAGRKASYWFNMTECRADMTDLHNPVAKIVVAN
jgi:hypothetical protein